ncbi:MAG: ABC transporter permease, partial [Gemmatimonadota bacterium]
MLENLKIAARSLRRRPGLTVAAALTLALGIGATTTIYSVVQATLLKPLAFARPEELTAIVPVFKGVPGLQLSYPNFRDLKSGSRAFAGMAPFRFYLFNLAGKDDPESVLGMYVGSDLFPMLGVEPIRGRQLLAGADEKGAAAEALLTMQLWQRRYGSDPGMVGKTIIVDGKTVTVAGILPAGTSMSALAPADAPLPSREPDLYLNMGSDPDDHTNRGNDNYWILGRLAPGISMPQANASLAIAAHELASRYPDHDANLEVRALGLKSQMVGESGRPLMILLGAVSLLLLIACANVAGLLAARAADRQRETALRVALGASPWRLAQQVITESLVLALLGGSAGILIAAWAVPAFRAAAPNTLPRLAEVSLDGTVLMATIGITLLVAVLAGLPPALSGGQVAPAEVLKEGGRGSGGLARRRLRHSLTMSQVALSMVLLCGAGLLFRSLLRVTSVKPGFDTTNVLTMMTILPLASYPDPIAWGRFAERSIEAIRQLPGVEAVGSINTLPLSNLGNNTGFQVVGGPALAPADVPSVPYRPLGGELLKALRIPLLSGRPFGPGDTAGVPLVAIVNAAAVKRFFNGADPIGRQIHLGNDGDGINRTVIGVLADTRENGLDVPEVAEVYQAVGQGGDPVVSLAIRTSGDPRAALPAVRQALASVDPSVGFFAVRTMDELMAGTLARRRFNLDLLIGFSVAALLLAGVGLYGVIAYSASQRSREIGIRMALGAGQRSVIWLFFREGLVMVGVGAAIGLGVALALGRVLASQLYGIGASDPVAYGAVAVLLGGVASMAVLIPARRAT